MNDILGTVADPSRAPLVVIAGPPGIGRSTLLATLHAALDRRGLRTASLRFSPNEYSMPQGMALRLAQNATPAAGPSTSGALAPGGLNAGWSRVGPVTGAHTDPAIANRAATIMAAPLVQAGNTVLLIDDVQWADLDSVAVLEALVRKLAGTTVSCVCAVRLPLPPGISAAGQAIVNNLRRAGLARVLNLRPLGRADITAMVVDAVDALPDPALVTQLVRFTRGVPAAVRAAIEGYQQSDSIRIVYRHAYVVPPRREPPLPANHDLVQRIRRLGGTAWSVAKAIAVLHPLEDAAPDLISEPLGIPSTEVHAALELLRSEGVLRHSAGGKSWRFAVPLVATMLRVCLGPFERRQLAEKAVVALWGGSAHCADQYFLADQLVNAGRFVAAEPARNELCDRAGEVMFDDGDRAERWLRAAVTLSTDKEQRAETLLRHAAACYVHGLYQQSLQSSETVLRDLADHLSVDLRRELQVLHVLTLLALGDTAALEAIAGDDDTAGLTPERVTSRALAMALLDRPRDAYALLAATKHIWQTGDPDPNDTYATYVGHLVECTTSMFIGERSYFEQNLELAKRWLPHHAERYRLEIIRLHTTLLLMAGEANLAEEMLIEPLSAQRLRTSTQALLATQRGRFDDAIVLAGRSIAANSASRFDAGMALHSSAATILFARGRLAGSRDVLTMARKYNSPLPYLLEVPEALIDRTLGQREQARLRLREGIDYATNRGQVMATDDLWVQLAEMAVETDDSATARQCLAEVGRIADIMGTSRSALNHLVVRSIVERDNDSAGRAIVLARERNQPFELACTIAKLAEFGVGDQRLLAEAYEIFGELDALLYRALTRNLMRDHGVAVPGRQLTVSENERLLAVLVAEGLGNKELATVLKASEKSVEGRLSRLFARSGYRSRVELATAVFRGEYEV